ncbi:MULTISPECIES: acetyl-CoA carboxylase biotin carboxyl carrier protein [Bacillaceae]|uniref:Biotin carboxyl carrier protein of acetyl-CoA carboxylase n=1 Tax=Evansella alkalicola TaxID=745819 RepID=A0ABS6K0I9_9BACI|nr:MULTISPECIES: acetyl-CoA carboxylase biotin carboxyl carrier protein [Bacillaceae]MBU9724165.1 acetyl-CoA carboxylase biotin carboxyl carrier protein [Bacillus alkalicola]
MLKIQEIRELIKLIDDSSIDEFKFEQNGSKITMKKQASVGQVQQIVQEQSTVPATVPTVTTSSTVPQSQTSENVEKQTAPAETEVGTSTSATVSGNLHTITSPMVGTFYAAPSPDSDPYVKTGDKIKEDSVVCIVEAMKLMNEIEAEVNGEIVEVLVENGQLVEYGQELFLVKPE